MILMMISWKRYLKHQIRKAAKLVMMMKAMTIKKTLTPMTLPMTLMKKVKTTMKAMMKMKMM